MNSGDTLNKTANSDKLYPLNEGRSMNSGDTGSG